MWVWASAELIKLRLCNTDLRFGLLELRNAKFVIVGVSQYFTLSLSLSLLDKQTSYA